MDSLASLPEVGDHNYHRAALGAGHTAAFLDWVDRRVYKVGR